MIRLPVYCIYCKDAREVVEFLARDKSFTASVKKKIRKNFTNDLLQDLYIIFLTEIPEEKLMELNAEGTVVIFAYGILKKRLGTINKSTTSYKNYRSFISSNSEHLAEYIIDKEGISEVENLKREQEYVQDKQKKMSAIITKLDLQDKNFWYKWKIFTEYVEGSETFEEFANRTGIEIYSLKWASRKAKEMVINEIKNKNGNT